MALPESIRVHQHRLRRKTALVALLGGECVRCGYCKVIQALQFHHVDPSTKLFELGMRNLSKRWEVLEAEARKCELLCANCHAEEHAVH